DLKLLVGTGPYRLERYESGTGLYLYKANDDYFLGKPYIKRLETVPIDNQLGALVKGDVDFASPGVNTASKRVIDQFRKDPKYGILEGKARRIPECSVL
ncbi:MAG: ABC transporter substrate-binding protein, partial [Actinomycetota bacterium]